MAMPSSSKAGPLPKKANVDDGPPEPVDLDQSVTKLPHLQSAWLASVQCGPTWFFNEAFTLWFGQDLSVELSADELLEVDILIAVLCVWVAGSIV
jgi:hypothetical protein